MKHDILVDLSLAHFYHGFSGIPQDSRLLFNGLMHSQEVKTNGLIFGTSPSIYKPTRDELESVSQFLGIYLAGRDVAASNSFLGVWMQRLFPHYYKLVNRYLSNKRYEYSINPVDMKCFGDLVWRNFFYKVVDSKDQALFLKQGMYWSSITTPRMFMGANGRRPVCELNTQGFDFVIFQDSRLAKLPQSTHGIIRYHDGLPVFAGDTFQNGSVIFNHLRSVRACVKNKMTFVCNSTSALNDLINIAPEAENNAYVIPYFLPKMEKKQVDRDLLEKICAIRRSSSTKPKKEASLDTWLGADRTKMPKFILSLATIEPRKNYIGLIEAWMRLRYETGEDIKLMIVGRPGWEFEPTLNAMRPFVKTGDLMHLEGVAQLELPYLYSAAACFVFPSFGEGFGLPPNEAMQCDCPVAVSDIAAHRYSVGEAGIYFNPYDTEDMAQKMKFLLDENNDHSDRIQKGHDNVARYSREAVLPQWEALFDKLKKEKLNG